MSASADRLTAVRLLVRVEDGAFASRLLERVRAPGVRVRVMGVLRWLRALDAVLQTRCRRPLGRLDPEVRAVLRSALFEAQFLGVPVPVATDQAVRLVRRVGKSSAAGLVNAICRRASSGWTEVLADKGLDVRLSHPKWLLSRWRKHFGEEPAEAMARANQEPAPLWVWFSEAGAPPGLRESDLRAHPWCPGAWTAPEAGPELAEAVGRGDAHAQDPASQLVAHLAVRLVGKAGQPRMADLCAAPGGKTLLMAAQRRWAEHVAVEIHHQRARRLAVTVARSRAAVRVTRADGLRPPLRPEAWDLVLLDAPCSGTGTMRRHPELRWRLGPDDLGEMHRRQEGLVGAALNLLAPGGVLLYATCSVEPEENEALLGGLPPGFEPRPLEPYLPSSAPVLATAAGGVRILPGADSDGFTIHAVEHVDGEVQSRS